MAGTSSLQLALRKAKKLGATTVGTFYIPARKWKGVAVGYVTEAEPFTHHFFNAEGLEVAYHMPELGTFFHFEEPRAWSIPKPPLERIP